MIKGRELIRIHGVKSAIFVERMNRFTVRVREGKGERTCHLHDPGRLHHLLSRGVQVLVVDRWRPGRATTCDVVAVFRDGVIVLEDTRLPNKLFEKMAELVYGTCSIEKEVYIAGSRIDFVLTTEKKVILVEVKGTNLVVKGTALFPDAPSQRAVKHIDTLGRLAAMGYSSHLFFMVLRPDAQELRPNRAVDPAFAAKMCANSSRVRYLAARINAKLDDNILAVYYGGEIPVKPCT